VSSDSDAECSLSVDEDVLADVHAAAAATQPTARQFTSYIRCLRKEGQFISDICTQGRRHGVDWGGPIHPSLARGCSWDWYRSGEFLAGRG